MSQNSVNVYNSVSVLKNATSPDSVSELPKGKIEIKGEYEKGDEGIFGDNIYRTFIRTRLTNTGNSSAIYFVSMFFKEKESLGWFSSYKHAYTDEFFRLPNGLYTNQITLEPGASEILEFDLFRKNMEKAADIDVRPEKNEEIRFQILSIPASDSKYGGINYAGNKEYIFQDNPQFNALSKRSDYRIRTDLSRTNRSGEAIKILMPLSIDVSKVPGENRLIVFYTIHNYFDNAVNYELIQPVPDNMSASTDNGQFTDSGIRFAKIIDEKDLEFFHWTTHYTSADDFTLPPATLRFRHPETGEELELTATLSSRKASELTPLSFGLTAAEPWKIGQTGQATFTVKSNFSEDQNLALSITLTDSENHQIQWNANGTATVGAESDIPVTSPNIATTFVSGTALLDVTVTLDNGLEITAIEDMPVKLIKDNDSDTLPDTWETENGLNPSVNDAASDKDNDGLTNAQEYEQGTKANVADTDNDGLKDGEEVNTRNTDPLLADTDGGGTNDGDEVNKGTNPAGSEDDTPEVAIHLQTEAVFGEYILITWTPSNPFAPNVTYRFSAGTSAGSDNLIAWSDTGEQTSYALDTTVLTENQTCYVNIKLLQNGTEKASDTANLTAYRNHLYDAIQRLQVVAGIQSPTGTYTKTDINGDSRIGLEEAIDALQSAVR